MISDFTALMRACSHHPADDTPRLVMADYLDDLVEPVAAERASYIRGEVAQARAPKMRGWKAQGKRLLKQYQRSWCEPLETLGIANISFERGLPSSGTIDFHRFTQNSDQIYDLAPMSHLQVTGMHNPADVTAFLKSPGIECLAVLDLTTCDFGNDAIAPVLEALHAGKMGNLREINFNPTRIGYGNIGAVNQIMDDRTIAEDKGIRHYFSELQKNVEFESKHITTADLQPIINLVMMQTVESSARPTYQGFELTERDRAAIREQVDRIFRDPQWGLTRAAECAKIFAKEAIIDRYGAFRIRNVNALARSKGMKGVDLWLGGIEMRTLPVMFEILRAATEEFELNRDLAHAMLFGMAHAQYTPEKAAATIPLMRLNHQERHLSELASSVAQLAAAYRQAPAPGIR